MAFDKKKYWKDKAKQKIRQGFRELDINLKDAIQYLDHAGATNNDVLKAFGVPKQSLNFLIAVIDGEIDLKQIEEEYKLEDNKENGQ